jgi:hypothetical protein
MTIVEIGGVLNTTPYQLQHDGRPIHHLPDDLLMLKCEGHSLASPRVQLQEMRFFSCQDSDMKEYHGVVALQVGLAARKSIPVGASNGR